MKNAAIKDKFIEMRAEGTSYSQISEELGVSKQTLIAWGKTFQADIHNLKAIRMDEIYEKYALNKESRIKVIGELLEKIRLEILERNLKDLSTERLFDLLPKLSQLIEKEISPLEFDAPLDHPQYQKHWAV